MTCEEFEQIRDLHALGALLPDEMAGAEEHLAECAVCASKAEASWNAVQLLRLAVPQVVPRPGLRLRVIDEARRTEQGDAAGSNREPAVVRFIRAWPTLRWAAAAALPFALVAWLAVQMTAMERQIDATQQALQTSRDTSQTVTRVMSRAFAAAGRTIALQGTESALTASGKLYYMQGDREAVLLVSGLPPLHEGEVYQLWLNHGGEPISGGSFSPEPDGHGMLVVNSSESFSSYQDCVITSEPHGGSAAPGGQRYLWGRVAST